jgi:tetrahydromethanopterin S-methyltransferase subunit C
LHLDLRPGAPERVAGHEVDTLVRDLGAVGQFVIGGGDALRRVGSVGYGLGKGGVGLEP